MRRPLMLLVICLASLGGERAARAELGIIIPPLRADFGPLTVVDVAGARSGGQLVIGVHWASVYPRDTPIDVGFGLVTAFVDDGGGTTAKTAVTTVAEDDGGPSLFGGYLDLSSKLAGGTWWRSWGGLRGEALRAEVEDRERVGLGLAARIAAEVYVGGGGGATGGSGGGAMLGVFAIGAYAEASYRDVDGPLGGVGVSAGMTARVPFIIAGG